MVLLSPHSRLLRVPYRSHGEIGSQSAWTVRACKDRPFYIGQGQVRRSEGRAMEPIQRSGHRISVI